MIDGALTGHIYANGRLEVLGYVQKTRSGKIYLVHCNVCSNDAEQYGDANFKIYDSNILKGVCPCGCSKSYKPTDEQLTLRIQRSSVDKKTKFVRLLNLKSKSRKAVFLCEEHGEYIANCHDYMSGKGCRRCSKNNLKPDDVMILSFKDSGVFSEDTSFERSNKKNSVGAKIYWDVKCGVCSEEYTSTGQHLKNGKQGCSCSTKSIKYSYVLHLQDKEQSYIKFGISKNPSRRIKEHINTSLMDFNLLSIWEFPSPKDCKEAEHECKKLLQCGVVDRELWPSGWTETTFSYNLDIIYLIYRNYGGSQVVYS